MIMKLEEELKRLQRQKEALEKEIENIEDQIYFSYQKEKTDVAKKRLNIWYKKGELFTKILSITGNTYIGISISLALGFISEEVIYSCDYYPNEYKEPSKEELKEIENYFNRIK